MKPWTRITSVIALVLLVGGCGRSESPGSGSQPDQLITNPNGMDAGPPRTYLPTTSNGVMIVDLSRYDDVDSIPVSMTTTIIFQNPPDTGTNLWLVDYNPSAFTREVDGVVQPHERDHVEAYPAHGWVFKPLKPGKADIALSNVMPNLTGAYDNAYHFDIQR